MSQIWNMKREYGGYCRYRQLKEELEQKLAEVRRIRKKIARMENSYKKVR